MFEVNEDLLSPREISGRRAQRFFEEISQLIAKKRLNAFDGDVFTEEALKNIEEKQAVQIKIKRTFVGEML